MSNEFSGSFKEMFNSIKFCIDSKKGKYSLDTYLDIVGEYADRQIIAAENEGLEYSGGECIVKKSDTDSSLLEFSIELYFENQQGESIKKEAKRNLPLSKFVGETASVIGNETLKFNIQKPGDKK
ncbi:hypothetical protein [Clostridium fungisolvens]|uniref:Uncharacterized protein n=1 Tax=Clostridium fungisolvens TaxID=1604897 RepID=A0A6V8SHF0_9CLOT|nr:hypothetical protein [Clostridium fungisolvens]GFP76644.1 hypothetical protein bsdtw1_02747 [Clostridium fungisolvens]